MAYEIPFNLVGNFPASVDLSAAQFLAVTVVNSATLGNQFGGAALALSTATSPAVGILQNNPIAGEAGEVMVAGISKATAGANITAVGTLLAADATGKMIPATTGLYTIGVAMETANSGEVFAVLLARNGKI